MRIIYCIMILSMALSGYFNAAHASLSIDKISKNIQSVVDNSSSDANDEQNDAADSDTACHICCCSSATFNHINILQAPMTKGTLLSPLPDLSLKSDYIFSLLRPPKSSV
jgi:hypothetical protein